MKHLTWTFILLFLNFLPQAVRAQDTVPWIRVTSADEHFTAEMPQEPEIKKQKNKYLSLDVDAQLYTSVDKDTTYAIWSLRNTSYVPAQMSDGEKYLDDCAELVWESLLEPEKEKLPRVAGVHAYMAYVRGLNSGTYPGREYSITLGRTRGITNFFVAGERIYVLTVLNAAPDDDAAAGAQRFFKSFAIREGSTINPPPQPGDRTSSTEGASSSTGAAPAEGVAYGPGRGGNTNEAAETGAAGAVSGSPVDYDRVFSSREVTQKARLLSRPEPTYTESARKYGVQGTVVIRAVISNKGQIVNAKAIKGLPHGLTATALDAAKLIRCLPALKDGREVAQFIQIEYNFNLY
jgi:TonB family protein